MISTRQQRSDYIKGGAVLDQIGLSHSEI